MMIDDPLIGRQLANYKIERVIGRGGMAVVYYGQDVKLRRPVAIKVIDARYRDNPAYAERFVREAQAVALWRHENIIHIYYASDEDGLYYFVMEYVDGIDLGKRLAQYATQRKRLPPSEVIRIGRAMANALDYAHQRDVIHRDVKPANVLLADDNRVVLTDFGLAMDVQHGSLGEVFGSSLYISPEQARRSADAVPQSDQYSLGVILYQMLTGALPFEDPSPASVALQHVTRTPPPPRQLNPALNVETENVLLKVLSKAPADRYATCREFVDALQQAVGLASPEKTQPSKTTLLAAGDETLIGLQLDEYRLEALLGHGGMARIYRARDTRLNRPAAVKVIDASFRADAEYMARFMREAQAIAQLDHPNIVRVYRSGEVSDVLYIAMQYIEGRDLQAILDENGQTGALLFADRVRQIIAEVCAALDYAHVKGVIHRDVKPSNIIIDQRDHAVLTDFGLALLIDSGTRGEIFGSPFHIAPEQAISSANVTLQSDLYSVGVILYEMLTGRVPFTADNPLDVAMLHMTEPPRPPCEINPQINPQVEAVILKALAKEPRDRYQTGAELVEALDQALRAAPAEQPVPIGPSSSAANLVLPPIPAAVAVPAVTPIAAPPVSTHAPRKNRRRAIALTVLGLIVIMIVAGLALASQTGSSGSAPIAAVPPTSTSTSTPMPAPTVTITTPAVAIAPTSTAVAVLIPPLTPMEPAPFVSPLATDTLSPTPTITASPAITATLAIIATPTIASLPAHQPPYKIYCPVVMKNYRAKRK